MWRLLLCVDHVSIMKLQRSSRPFVCRLALLGKPYVHVVPGIPPDPLRVSLFFVCCVCRKVWWKSGLLFVGTTGQAAGGHGLPAGKPDTRSNNSAGLFPKKPCCFA